MSHAFGTPYELRANSGLKASEYGTPVLGLIFLRFAEARFEAARGEIEARASERRKIGPSDYQAQGIIYLAPEARFSALLDLPEARDLGKAANEAMRLVEEHNRELAGVLPRRYTALDNSAIASLLRHISSYTKDLKGDAFGLIYEYFLARFALAEGQGAGEFFTPASIVRSARRIDPTTDIGCQPLVEVRRISTSSAAQRPHPVDRPQCVGLGVREDLPAGRKALALQRR